MARAQGSRCGLWSPRDPAPFFLPCPAACWCQKCNTSLNSPQSPLTSGMRRHTLSSSPVVSIPNHGRDQRETRSGLAQSRSRRGLGRGRIAASDWTLALSSKSRWWRLARYKLAGAWRGPAGANAGQTSNKNRFRPSIARHIGWVRCVGFDKGLSRACVTTDGDPNCVHFVLCLGGLQMFDPNSQPPPLPDHRIRDWHCRLSGVTRGLDCLVQNW